MSRIIDPHTFGAVTALRLLLHLARQVGELIQERDERLKARGREHILVLPLVATETANRALRDSIVSALNRLGSTVEEDNSPRCAVAFVVQPKSGRVCVRCELDEKHEGPHEAPVVLARYLEE